MKPERLFVHGFRSYAEPVELDLSGIHAAAITGVNGSGKTSLVTAISYALYGQAFADLAGISLDALINEGSMEMRVAFDCRIGDELYRFERQRSRAGRGSSMAMVYRWSDAAWQPLAGPLIAEADAMAKRILGMSAALWWTSSFVAQGDLDRFFGLRPAERRRVVTEILELDRWGEWAAKSSAIEREQAGQVAALRHRVEQLEAVLAGEPQAQVRMEAAQAAEQQAVERASGLESSYTEALKSLESAQADQARIEQAWQHLEHLRRQRLVEQHRLENEARRLDAETRAAEQDLDAVATTVAKLEQQSGMAPKLEGDAIAKQTEADRLAYRIRELELQAAAEETHQAAWLERTRAATARTPDLKSQIEHLSKADGARCPTCEQELDAQARDALLRRIQDERNGLMAEAAEARTMADQHASAAGRVRQEISELDQQSRALLAEASDLRLAADRASQAAERLRDERARLQGLQERAGVLRIQLEETHASQVADIPEEERRLEAQLDAARDLEARLADTRNRADSLHRDLAEARGQVARTAADTGAATEALAAFDRHRSDVDAARSALTGAEERQRSALWLTPHLARHEPGRLIDQALPRIEENANRLLAEFWDGWYRVRLVTERALKSSDGVRETLDILVSDPVSERELATFSGAEADSVKLALRIALALELGMRAGHPIETLILDESVLSFDAVHKQRAVGVLKGLADTFSTLLVISHDQELAASLAQRIQVTGGHGEPSQVEILDQIGAAA